MLEQQNKLQMKYCLNGISNNFPVDCNEKNENILFILVVYFFMHCSLAVLASILSIDLELNLVELLVWVDLQEDSL